MESSAQHWLWLRITAVGLSFLSARWSLSQMSGDFSRPSVLFAIILTGFCAFGVAFVWLLQKMNPWSSATWQRPSWSASPFTMHAPLQLFHLGGWCSVATGLGGLVFDLFVQPRDWAWEVPLSAGVGILLGVRLVSDTRRSGAGT